MLKKSASFMEVKVEAKVERIKSALSLRLPRSLAQFYSIRCT